VIRLPQRSGRAGRLLLAAVLVQPLILLAASSVVGALPTPPPVPGGPLPTAPSNPLIPPIGQQPGTAAPPCSASPLGPTEIRVVYQLGDQHSSAPQQPASTFAVDPATPCRLFRTLAHSVVRSDDSGHSFAPVFVDPATQSSVSQGPSVLSPVITAGGQSIYLYDQGGTNGVFESVDDGHNWVERDNGLYAANVQGPTGPTGGILAFAAAPSAPATLYLVGTAGGQTVLYSSGDGGGDWLADGQPPSPQVTSLSVDPRDPRHIFVAAGGPETSWGAATAPAGSGSSFYESSDGGTTWQTDTGPAKELSPTEVIALRGTDGSLRLYARTASLDSTLGKVNGQRLWRSSDGGLSWHIIPVPSSLGLDAAFAADPTGNPDIMALAAAGTDGNGHPGMSVVGSLDGFRTSRYARFIDTPGDVTAMEARADSAGDIFVQATYGGTDELLAFRVTALSPPPPPPGSGGPLVPTLRECPLQDLFVPGSPPGVQPTQVAYDAGSIAYDGRYLDYTQDETAPGTIFRVDPVDCAQVPPIQLNPSDTGGQVEALYALTYDPTYRFPSGDIGALLVRGAAVDAHRTDHDPRVPSTNAAVYAVDPLSHSVELSGSVYCQAPAGNDGSCGQHDPSVFSYDPYLGDLWASVQAGQNDLTAGLVGPPRPGATSLPQLATCMANFVVPDTVVVDTKQSDWVSGGPNLLFVQQNDNRTVLRVDSASCHVIDTFQHAATPESTQNEDDQMACDSLTFGEGASGVPAGTGTSVLWLRDVAGNKVRAFPVVSGFCPFPSQLSLDPVGTIQAATPVTLCATLSRIMGDGTPAPIAATQVQMSFAGRPAGVATTDSAGRACLPVTAPSAGGTVRVHASFAGNQQYMAADADQPAVVQAGPPPHKGQSGNGNPPGPPPPVVPGHAAPVPAPPPLAVQAPVQVQAQTQAQPQPQWQSQPAAAAQRRTQARVALQHSDGTRAELELEASQLRLSWLAEALALALFGAGLAARAAHLRKSTRDSLRPARTQARPGIPRPTRRRW